MDKITPKDRDPVFNDIRDMLKSNQAAIIMEYMEDKSQLGFAFAVPEEASEDFSIQVATLSSIITGMFLLPDEVFNQIIHVTNYAMIMEASKNPWFQSLLNVPQEEVTRVVEESSEYAGV